MDKAKEYRANAAAAMKLAARSDDDDVKAAILSVAQGWLELADPWPKDVMRPEDQPNRRTH
jgi:hypothetical protein